MTNEDKDSIAKEFLSNQKRREEESAALDKEISEVGKPKPTGKACRLEDCNGEIMETFARRDTREKHFSPHDTVFGPIPERSNETVESKRELLNKLRNEFHHEGYHCGECGIVYKFVK